RNPRRAAATHSVSKSEFSENASVVLSFIAYAGHSPRLPAPAAFAAGIRALPGLSLHLLPDKECHFRRLDAALARLAGIPPSQKQPLLTAAAQTAAADGVIEPAEAELLRAIACSLDCPMPPLG
ncbi:MAG: hypothetical protein LBV28_03100, partial [Puniceicoccales bacterium]|nr:hypothetical protein [Puniceicoccales bacterium]